MARLVKTLIGERVEVAAWQFIPERMAQIGLTDEDGMAQAWYVSADSNHVSGGAEAINDTLRHAWYFRPFTYLYYVPGIRQLQDWGYKWVADHRYQMPGSTAACAVNLPKPDHSRL